jgi:hypothetical protein
MTDMHAAWDAQVAKLTATGTRLITCSVATDPFGLAYIEDGVPCVVVCTAQPIEGRLFTLFHEIGHHVLGHTMGWSSIPLWEVEYTADRFAINAMAEIDPGNPAYEDRSRAHIRPLLQSMIDGGIWNHVDLTIADWAGCRIGRRARTLIEAQNAA